MEYILGLVLLNSLLCFLRGEISTKRVAHSTRGTK
uniref:Uncharacterized protein n=1 Tax=Arundo donax TaxID=35708 RepID=A0A0A9FR93_ARUDO